MTKSELIDKLVEVRNSLTRKDSEAVVSLVFDAMSEALTAGDKVEIRGFGSFVSIPSKKTPFFKTGKDLRERVNNL